ncbi:MAG: triphosphoribosyl-dephospho-CoA synthase [Pseudomonadota bacterium]|nr:triphosphoribosyl-dephospho-CoA synthase [Pseudomonadota bacterium]
MPLHDDPAAACAWQTPAALAALVRDCCAQDVRAFKPGNVSVAAPGHAMEASHFLRSAAAAAIPLASRGARVGARVEAAIGATWQVVDCNTNLGIVLLLAPLLKAAEQPASARAGENRLREVLVDTLAALDREDAAACYRAIRQARPGGLGHSGHHDVADEPRVTLLAAMQEAAARDGVAFEYVSGFAQVFETGVPCLRASAAAGEAELWALTRCFLTLLAARPDSHVVRRHGAALANQVSATAAALLARWQTASTAAMWPVLRECDRDWKAAGINPGTTADLVVASLAVMRLQQARGYNGARHTPGALVLRERPQAVAPGKSVWAPSHEC